MGSRKTRTKFNITNQTQQHQKLEQRNKMRQDKVNNASGLELSLCDHAREKVSRVHHFLGKNHLGRAREDSQIR